MPQEKPYVCVDDHGVYRVAATRVMLDAVVASFHQGHSPESIRQQYPALTLEEVYGSIAYYLANRPEVDAYLARQQVLWDELRRQSALQPSPVVERLRGLKQAQNPVGTP
jgi:uncharacterized protein (DUF433 family)